MNKKEKYWNDYVDYWKEKTKDTKEVPNDKIIEWLINQVGIKGYVLEVGCGFGRLFSYYEGLDVKVYAIDISARMVEEAWNSANPNIIHVEKAKAEKIPYSTNAFDYVICMGTFDCLEQEKALSEMMRVLKIGGKLLITGKNINYFKDDHLAREAERKAKENGHPNLFTDLFELYIQLKEGDHKILSRYFFLRRGDFSKRKFTVFQPEYFYEYFIVIEKGSNLINFKKFSKGDSNSM